VDRADIRREARPSVERSRYSTGIQDESGLYSVIAAPRAAVFAPKFFWYTMPFTPQMKVSTPLSP
jgi:hypothetical protein